MREPSMAQASAGLKSEAILEKEALQLVQAFKDQGFDTLAYDIKAGTVYGCHENDVPRGALEVFSPIDSHGAIVHA